MTKQNKGKVYLLPTTLGNTKFHEVLPQQVKSTVEKLNFFIVENVRTARRFISFLDIQKNIDECTFFVLNKHTTTEEMDDFLSTAFQGHDLGVLSEAGVPCIADPGSGIVSKAHLLEIEVIPLVGPSSIILSLMASGLNGQNFSFVGYVPIKKPERVKRLKQLEYIMRTNDQTQLFIETPYRNLSLFEDIIRHCSASTRLCIACNLTTSGQYIRTLTIAEWKHEKPDIHKKPAIFLLGK